MLLFVLGTLVVLAFLSWATYRTAIFLRQANLEFNLLLLPAENLLRLGLIAVCIWLAQSSSQPFAQFGWQISELSRDIVVGFAVGIPVALILPPFTHWAIAQFGPQVYSPVIVRNILPRSPREWLLVPLALVPSVFLEELLFRSLLLGGFAIFSPPMLLAVIWSIIFGAMHLPQGVLGIAVAAALGMLLSILFLATSSLLTPFVAHYVINFLQMVWASKDKSWLAKYAVDTRSRS